MHIACNIYYIFSNSQIAHISNHFLYAITTATLLLHQDWSTCYCECHFCFPGSSDPDLLFNYSSFIDPYLHAYFWSSFLFFSLHKCAFLYPLWKEAGYKLPNFKKWLLCLLYTPKLISYFPLHLLNWPQLGLFFQ